MVFRATFTFTLEKTLKDVYSWHGVFAFERQASLTTQKKKKIETSLFRLYFSLIIKQINIFKR